LVSGETSLYLTILAAGSRLISTWFKSSFHLSGIFLDVMIEIGGKLLL